jgi:1,4-dihydroxy-2-naphthoyl-CoA hydrolase
VQREKRTVAIWFVEADGQSIMEALEARSAETMVQHLGIEYLEIGERTIRARMPVDHRTVQPAGILHGGASVTLAETLGSVGAFLCIDPSRKQVVGLEVNANHVRPVSSGYVYGLAEPLHLGNRTQLWQIEITNEEDKLVCIARLTVAVLDREG